MICLKTNDGSLGGNAWALVLLLFIMMNHVIALRSKKKSSGLRWSLWLVRGLAAATAFALGSGVLDVAWSKQTVAQTLDCPQGIEAFTQGLHKKLRKDCAYCHGGQGPGPSHSVEDPKASYKMIKNLLNLSSPIKLDRLAESKFITTGGNNHCANMGVECNTSSEELMSLVKPWIAVEMKSCQKASAQVITSEKASVLNQGKLNLKIPGYDQVRVQTVLDTHVASEQGKGYIKLKNFKICHPNARVTVHGIKIIVDGQEDNYATLQERTFEPCNQELSPETILFSAQKLPITSQNQIQVQAETLTVGPVKLPINCQYPQYYNEVITPLIQSSCLNCHNQNNSPLGCESLIETYKQSGASGWKQYFMSGQYHSRIGSTLQAIALTHYLNLESTDDNSLIYKFSKGFDKLTQYLNPESTKDNSLTGRLYTAFDSLKNLLKEEVSESQKYTTVITGSGSVHTCALNEITHLAKCWGNNYGGQLGYGKEVGKKLLQGVAPLPFKNIKQIVVGNIHTCVLLNDGTAKCWGANYWGQLGYGEKGDYKFLQDVNFLPLKNIKQISVGSDHTCALFIDGRAKCWGYNFWGQLGYGDTNNRILKDVNFLPLKNIQQISAGEGHTCAVLDFGRIKCWGRNDAGQLGYSSINILYETKPNLNDVPFFPLLESFK